MGHEHDHEQLHANHIPHEHSHDHDNADFHCHAHEHAHTHDGDTHSHAHEHPHAHGHCHDHDKDHAHCDRNCAGCVTDPKAEMVALLNYMVNHNAAHANELANLAKQIGDAGDKVAYEQVMAAVSDYEKGNMRLSAVLAAMNMPK